MTKPKNNNKNPYNMVCAVCGVPLVPSDLTEGNKYKVEKVIDFDPNWKTNRIALVCPKRDNYSLTDITSNIKADDITISSDVVKDLKKQGISIVDLKILIKDKGTKVYAVGYSFFTRLRLDKTHFRKKPSPSYQVLDSVSIYICAKANYVMSNTKKLNITFAIVTKRMAMLKFEYKIVWFS